MYTSELNMRTKIAYVIGCLRVPPDRESDVTWHHVIVHGCKGQKYLNIPDHRRRPAPCGGIIYQWRGNYMYGSYLGVGIQVPMRQ